MQQRRKGELLADILESGPRLARAASEAGLEIEGQYVLLGFRPGPHVTARSAELSIPRMLDAVALQVESVHPGSLTAVMGNHVYALMRAVRASRLQDIAEAVVTRLGAQQKLEFFAVIGNPMDTLRAASASRADVDVALRVLVKQPGAVRVASYSDVAPQAMLLQVFDALADRELPMATRLQRLVSPEVNHQYDLLETLRAYFDSSCDAARAARRLGIHPNTFRYRLGRAVEAAGAQLDDPADKFVLELAVRVHYRDSPAASDSR